MLRFKPLKGRIEKNYTVILIVDPVLLGLETLNGYGNLCLFQDKFGRLTVDVTLIKIFKWFAYPPSNISRIF